ncbi:MAG: extracellular solute-binding protein [Alphaproteobacteria bacterium]
MHGKAALPPDFQHFTHSNPQAPKGGTLRLSQIGGFDSLNPFIVRGLVPKGVKERVFQSLMTRNPDEPFTLYEGLAARVEIPDDRKSITFHLHKTAKWSDGKPVTVEDVEFSLNILSTKGRPNHRHYYGQVEKTERVGEHGIRFHFGAQGNREIPLILALMPILPKHVYKGDAFAKTWSSPPIGSGPYEVAAVELGRSLTLSRKQDWWGKDRPVNVGRYNFDEIKIINFRNRTAAFEAFKAGDVDAWFEADPQKWASDYTFPAAKDGRLMKSAFENGWPAGMLGLAFNTRRDKFKDRYVRNALIHAFDFEWMNRIYFHGAYKRTQSFFEKSQLAAHGTPTAKEVSLAQDVGAKIDAQGYQAPKSDGSGNNRRNLRKAVKLMKDANAQPFTFEILLADPAHERMMLAYAKSLQTLGITAKIRTVDSAQFEARRATYDYDAIIYEWGQSLSPGNEQSFYWATDTRDREGTRNYFGVNDPATDNLIEKIVAARTYEDLTLAVKVLDRTLLHGRYVLPLYHSPVERVAHWQRVKLPGTVPLFGLKPDRWWYEEAAD